MAMPMLAAREEWRCDMVTVSIAEAAQRLGISEKTVRRRLTRPQGYTWAVHLDDGVNGHRTNGWVDEAGVATWINGAGQRFRELLRSPMAYALVGFSLLAVARRLARS